MDWYFKKGLWQLFHCFISLTEWFFFFKNLKKFAERNQTTKTENLYLLILLYTLLLYTLIYTYKVWCIVKYRLIKYCVCPLKQINLTKHLAMSIALYAHYSFQIFSGVGSQGCRVDSFPVQDHFDTDKVIVWEKYYNIYTIIL